MTEFHQDLQDAHARALERDPLLDDEGLADSPEVAEVLKRWTRPEPVSSPSVMAAAQDWADRLLNQ
jgi:hypothetical protein